MRTMNENARPEVAPVVKEAARLRAFRLFITYVGGGQSSLIVEGYDNASDACTYPVRGGLVWCAVEVCPCGKNLSHVDADEESADWPCLVPSAASADEVPCDCPSYLGECIHDEVAAAQERFEVSS